jgi:hypothetical protein
MDKRSLLDAVSELAAAGELSEAELIAAFRGGTSEDDTERVARHTRYSRVLYFIGGGVVITGIVALIGQIWNDLGAAMHIVVTLGSGLAAYVVGVLLSSRKWLGAAGPAFFLISALVLPLGMVVTLDEAGISPEGYGWQSLIALLLMGAFLAAYLIFRANSVLVYAIIYATWLFFGVTSWLVGPNPIFDEVEFLEYRILGLGLAYLVLGYAFEGTEREALSGALYGFGCLGFLGAALALGGWEPSQNVFWELVFPGLVFSVLYASVHLKSKALLTFGSLFLGAYLVKITSEYFSDSLGWPLALVLAGLMLMGVGYLTLHLKRRYLTQ